MKKTFTVLLIAALFDIATLVFFILKLTHVINWSWVWVTAPLWGGYGLILLSVAAALAYCIAVGRKTRALY